jgi:hypothetical protein
MAMGYDAADLDSRACAERRGVATVSSSNPTTIT